MFFFRFNVSKKGFFRPGFFPGKLIHLCFVFWHIHGGKICFIFLLPKSVKHMYKVIQNSVLLFFVCFSSVIVALFCFCFCLVQAFADRGYVWDVFVVVLGLFFSRYYDSICLLVWFVLLFQAAILDLYVCISPFFLLLFIVVVCDRYSRKI